MHKIRTQHAHKDGKMFSWLSLMLGLSLSLLTPIFPNFIKSILVTDSLVSIFYAAMSVVMLLAAIFSGIILKRFDRTKIAKISFILLALGIFSLIFGTTVLHVSFGAFLLSSFSIILTIVLGLFVRDFAKKQDLGKEEGLHYKFQNIGYFVGPFLGGFLAVKLSDEIVFILSALILLVATFYFHHAHVIRNHPAIVDRKFTHSEGLFSNLKEFFSNNERTKAYFVTFFLMSWIAFKRLFIPLFVIETGYKDTMSGLILSLAILPLILLEVKVGDYADKKGIRLPISTGFLIMGALLTIIFFNPFTLVSFLLLVLINIGEAFIEPLQEYYLFKHLPPKDEDRLYGIYMTADPIAYFVVSLIGALTLFFLPMKFIFLIFGAIFSLISYLFWLKLRRS